MPGDEEDTIIYTVTEIKDDKAVLDGNHPLAGINMVFEGTVTEIYSATQEEIDAMLQHKHSDDCGCGDH
jgi:FKBP-type peptidyl-prolyl cis-trans isomerase SlyD